MAGCAARPPRATRASIARRSASACGSAPPIDPQPAPKRDPAAQGPQLGA
jgi:hypothetical protein